MSGEHSSSAARPTLRELEALRALIAGRKTTAAALSLGVSQPMVSRAVAALERRVGRALFRRDGGRLVPTAEALALNAQAALLLDALEHLLQPKPGNEGRLLRLAAPPTLAHLFLPPLVRAFLQAEPDTRLHVEIGKNADVIHAVAEGATDLGLTDTVVAHSGVATEPFRRANGHVVMPAGHPLSTRDEIGPADLAGEPLVALTRRFPSRAHVDRAFGDAGIRPRILAEVTTATFAASLVRTGCGLAILNPFPLILADDGSLDYRPFAPRVAYETSFVFSSVAPPHPVARRFADHVRREQPPDPFSTPLRP